jgi:hypothetical protein
MKRALFGGVEKTECVLQFERFLVQLRFLTNYGRQAPTREHIFMWHMLFAEAGSICGKKETATEPNDEIVLFSMTQLLFVCPTRGNFAGGKAVGV